MLDDEKFFAWLDGELAAEEAARVEAEVAADPELQRRAAEHRALAARLRGAFGTVSAAPVPDALASVVQQQRSNVVDFSAWREKLSRPFTSPAPQWAAMAAALVLGIAVGTTLTSERGSSPVEVRGGAIYAAGAVDQALNRQLASADAASDVRIGLTFRDQSGAVCRTYETAASSGLACRESGSWRLRGLFAAPEGAGAEYRMAAGSDPRLLEMVDSTIAGEPFDAAQEQTARERGWR
jgi:hypothetical protein